jgi:hypothetical protein
VKIIYLDQNKWIGLSREAYDRDPTHRLKHVLKAVRILVRRGLACFPLSLGHYIETQRARDRSRRRRLARFMLHLSEGRTLASITTLMTREVDEALSLLFPGRVAVGPFELLGDGLGHTSAYADYRRVVVSADPVIQRRVDAQQDLFMLSGVLPGADDWEEQEQAARGYVMEPELGFHRRLADWATRSPGLDRDLRERLLCANQLSEVLEELTAALRRHGIREDELTELGVGPLMAMVNSMPWARVQMHLFRQLTNNPRLRIKPNDLTDWGHVGAAAAYCDGRGHREAPRRPLETGRVCSEGGGDLRPARASRVGDPLTRVIRSIDEIGAARQRTSRLALV